MSRLKRTLASLLIVAITVPTFVFQKTVAKEETQMQREAAAGSQETTTDTRDVTSEDVAAESDELEELEVRADETDIEFATLDTLGKDIEGDLDVTNSVTVGALGADVAAVPGIYEDMLGSVTPGDYDDPDEYMDRHDDYDFLNDGELATAADVKKPTKKNKKGIQGFSWLNGNEDTLAKDLGVNHVFMNLDLNDIVSDKITAYNYTYKGKTYYFTDTVHNYAKYVHDNLRPRGIAVTAEILLGNPYKVGPFIPGTKTPRKPNNKAADLLKYPGARDNTANHYYFGINTVDPKSRELFEAALHYIVESFNKKDTFIQNWIIGNEVNVPIEYNYIGTTSQTANVEATYGAYKILYDVVKKSSPYAKTYICVTNSWNDNYGGQGIPVRDFLDEFAYNCKRDNIGWNLAYHAYNPRLGQSMQSEENRRFITYDENSPFVTAANLSVMTDYIKNHFGSDHRVILSEQGFEAANPGCNEQTQAAELAYLYYAVERNDMVDCMHYALWKDENSEVLDGLHIGLLDITGKPRNAYYVFKFMDSNPAQIDKYKSVLSIQNWTDSPIRLSGDESVKITALNVRAATKKSNPENPQLEPGKLYLYMEPTLSNGVIAEKWNLEYKWTVGGKVMKNYGTDARLLRLESIPANPIEITAECRTVVGSSYARFDGVYMPATNDVCPVFDDVDYSSWYGPYVDYVVHNGIMSGTGARKFAPKDLCTREQMVRILYNSSGSPAVATANPFADNIPGRWYYNAVLWGYSTGVTSGIGGGMFGIGGNVTREQMAGFLYNYARLKGKDITRRADLSRFADAGAISGWAVDAVSWANASGIINGKSATILDPRGTATRAEVAAMICNFNNAFGR